MRLWWHKIQVLCSVLIHGVVAICTFSDWISSSRRPTYGPIQSSLCEEIRREMDPEDWRHRCCTSPQILFLRSHLMVIVQVCARIRGCYKECFVLGWTWLRLWYECFRLACRWIIYFVIGPGKGGPHGPYFQSERLDLYHKYTKRLLDVCQLPHELCEKILKDALTVKSCISMFLFSRSPEFNARKACSDRI